MRGGDAWGSHAPFAVNHEALPKSPVKKTSSATEHGAQKGQSEGRGIAHGSGGTARAPRGPHMCPRGCRSAGKQEHPRPRDSSGCLFWEDQKTYSRCLKDVILFHVVSLLR